MVSMRLELQFVPNVHLLALNVKLFQHIVLIVYQKKTDQTKAHVYAMITIMISLEHAVHVHIHASIAREVHLTAQVV